MPHVTNATSDRAELRWMGILKHVPFRDYGFDPGVEAAVACLSQQELFWGPTVLDANGDRVVTRGTIFRGPMPGDLVGPYLSQFLLGSAKEDMQRQPGTIARLPLCLADAIVYARSRSMYQPYLDAVAVMQQFPDIWRDADLVRVQAQVAQVATEALTIATDRYQFDRRLHGFGLTDEVPQQPPIPNDDKAKSEALAMVAQAAIAGAATAILVAEFSPDAPIPTPVVPAPEGLELEPYRSQGAGALGVLTVEGELDKLAANLVIARALPWMPWRKLFREIFELGEQIAATNRKFL
ncbi:MAG: hypothetical protein AAFY15_10425 [Cyanobacteria bacterium J06648_11]